MEPRFPHNTLTALCTWLHAGRDLPAQPVTMLVAPAAGVYASLDGIPIHPPVQLDAGQSVELWWFIEAGVIEYHHADTRRAREGSVPRRQLLTLLAMRRLLLERFGQPPPAVRARPAPLRLFGGGS